MSLIQTFVDAFKRGLRRNPKDDVDMKSMGPMGSTAEGDAGKFDPIKERRSGDPEEGGEVGGSPTVATSGDPEEGGEIDRGPTLDRPDAGQRPAG
jgi:hypothetical protein